MYSLERDTKIEFDFRNNFHTGEYSRKKVGTLNMRKKMSNKKQENTLKTIY